MRSTSGGCEAQSVRTPTQRPPTRMPAYFSGLQANEEAERDLLQTLDTSQPRKAGTIEGDRQNGSDRESDEDPAETAPGAWQELFDQAGNDRMDFQVINDAVEAWNRDKVACKLADKAAALVADSKPDLDEVRPRLQRRLDCFRAAFLHYLNRFWTFIKDLPQPIIIQRTLKVDSQGVPRVEYVKQNQPGFITSMQNRFVFLNEPGRGGGLEPVRSPRSG